MLDKLGNELKIGDEVIFIAPGYRMLVVGKITSFTPKMLKIEYINDWNYTSKQMTLHQTPDQVIKLKGE